MKCDTPLVMEIAGNEIGVYIDAEGSSIGRVFCMQFTMTGGTQSDQIQFAVGPELRAGPNVVNLKLLPAATVLTPPSVALQYLLV
jgi:hypothetical protein